MSGGMNCDVCWRASGGPPGSPVLHPYIHGYLISLGGRGLCPRAAGETPWMLETHDDQGKT